MLRWRDLSNTPTVKTVGHQTQRPYMTTVVVGAFLVSILLVGYFIPAMQLFWNNDDKKAALAQMIVVAISLLTLWYGLVKPELQ